MANEMRRLLVTLPVVAIAAGCVTDHGVLAEHEPEAGAAQDAAKTPAMRKDAAADAPSEAIAPPPQPEAAPPPQGRRSLTLVHGVTDSPWLAFCFTIVHDGKTKPQASPFPPGGLSYGASVRVADGDVADLAADGILPRLVLADSEAAVAGLDCAAIQELATQLAAPMPTAEAGAAVDAAPPGASDASVADASTTVDGSAPDGAVRDATVAVVPVAAVRVASLPLLPPGALSEARGYVLVAGGCAGGRGVTDPSQQSVCGESYTPTSPTLNAYVVAPPATAPSDRVALTVLGATPALTQMDLGFLPALGGDPVTVATRVVPGALRPLSAGYTGSSAAEIGATNTAAHVQLFAFGSKVPIYDQSWALTLDAGGVTDLENAASYTLVVVGPFPGFAKRRWWNDPLVTVVENR
jgi:hypothetical protein